LPAASSADAWASCLEPKYRRDRPARVDNFSNSSKRSANRDVRLADLRGLDTIHEQGTSRVFVLFVENENVDWPGHFNDVAAMIRDYREFDRAVALADDFYRKQPGEVLIIVAADHETGGLGFVQALKDLSSPRAKNRLAATTEDPKKNSIDSHFVAQGRGASRHPSNRSIGGSADGRAFQGIRAGPGTQTSDP
jgi:alkaline phosphatase